MSQKQVLKSSFLSNGVKCAATLRLPLGNAPFQAILMVHGWGGVQDSLTPPFYSRFNDAGFAVMTFDYAGWGDSEGEPRNVINPWKREVDVENALKHLRGLEGVDPNRIVLWGTSFGGGHVVSVASRRTDILGAIAQVPMLDGMAAVKAVPPTRLARFGLTALMDLPRGKRPLYLPVVSAPGEFGSMDRDGAYKILQDALAEGQQYDNRVAARSLLTMGLYSPFKNLKLVKIPILLIGATQDTVAPFVESRIRKLNNPQIRMQVLDANHFEPYFEPAFSKNIEYQLAFLRDLVPQSRSPAEATELE